MSEVWSKLVGGLRAATFREMCVTVTGGRLVTVENVSHVYECNEIMARVRAADSDVVIWGEGLEMGSYKEGTVRISGQITSVELNRRTGAKDD